MNAPRSPAVAQTPPRLGRLGWLDSVLRGLGQVMLQNNRWTGVLFLAGLFYSSRLFGAAALVGTLVSTAIAVWLGAANGSIRDGIFGFNGALTAIALIYLFQPNALAWVYTIFAAALTTIVLAAMLRWLERWEIPPLTAPFVLTSLCFLLAGASFGRVHPTHVWPAAELPRAAVVEGVVSLATVGRGLMTGIAQVFFQSSAVTGALFAVGLLISSRRACAFALYGSLLGLGVGWVMGAPEPSLAAGVFGFNSVLTAIAMDSLGLAQGAAGGVYTLLAVLATAVGYAAVSAALQPLGMPALTLPFVLAVWVFTLAARRWPQMERVPGSRP